MIVEVVEAYVHAGFPTDAAAVLLVEVDGLPGGVDRTDRAGYARSSLAHRRRHGPGGRRTGRTGPVVEGPEVGVRRRGPHRTQLLPARLRRAPDPPGRGAGRGEPHRRPPRADPGQRVPRRRRQPASVDRVRPPGCPGSWNRSTPPGEEIVEACVAAGGTLSGEHGIGLEKRDAMPSGVLGRPTWRPRSGCGTPLIRPAVATRRRCLPSGGSRCGDLADLPAGAWV